MHVYFILFKFGVSFSWISHKKLSVLNSLAMEAHRGNGGANNKRSRTLKIWHWKLKEDELLIELVQRHGPRNWNYIADHISGRTGVSCRLRWINHLNPKVDKTPFSEEEQERLLELHRDYRNKWATIAKFLPGRTDSQLKTRYHALVGSRNIKVSGSSSKANCEGRLNMGSVDASSYLSLSEVDVGPQLSHVTHLENSSGGCAACSTFMTDKTMMPSSTNAMAETWFAPPCSNLNGNNSYSFESANLGNINANTRKSHGYHMTSAVAQPQQGASVERYQFIDFLGVGDSE
ncbi:transcription factor myb44 [Phtheirospermum japonicum]|uniref:Transcription factor myb44 n=1 Tax=Phtheirospermum japonicum TaxID=374723 RepID=A0A830CUV9_9LAMI|nr:transcription factor myb44 [Phtheirospermum japonicum]